MNKCDECEKTGVNLIAVTDHPDYHDGHYCEDCNPYELDRKEAAKPFEDRIEELEAKLKDVSWVFDCIEYSFNTMLYDKYPNSKPPAIVEDLLNNFKETKIRVLAKRAEGEPGQPKGN